MSKSSVIYYVRHGESEANVSRVFSHKVVDHELTDLGWKQARQVADFLGNEAAGCGAIYASPLRRAIQTATPISERLGRPAEIIEEFRELNVGAFDGRSIDEHLDAWWAVIDAWASGARDTRFPGGENHLELTERIKRGIDRVLKPRHDGPHIIVAHAGVLRAGFSGFANAAPPHRLAIPNCSVSRIDVDSRGCTYSFAYTARSDFLS